MEGTCGSLVLPRAEVSENEVFRWTKLETLAFWDTYLKKIKNAKEYLTSDGLKTFSADAAKFAAK